MTAVEHPEEDFDQLVGLDPAGRPGQWWVRSVGEVPSLSALSVDEVELSDGRRLLRKTLPAQIENESIGQIADRQLDNEIRALVRLATRYPQDYPAELPRVVGYNYDAAVPFVLTTPYGQDTLGDTGGLRTLMVNERKAFQAGLFRAIAALAGVELVHGEVTLQAVRWTEDGNVQLTGFEHSASNRERPGSRQITVASQPLARRLADPADDVRDAGIALFELASGRRPTEQELSQNDFMISTVGPALSGVFSPAGDRRPTAVEVLRRLGDSRPVADPIDIAVALRPGHDRFDTLRPKPQPPAAPSPPPTVRRPPRVSRIPRQVLLMVGTGVFVMLVLLVLVVTI